jgi:hypothetical protein
MKDRATTGHCPARGAPVLLVLALLVGACGSYDYFGPGISLRNRTDGRITVFYLLPDGTKDTLFGELSFGPGGSTNETGIFRAYNDDSGCVPGTLVAESEGRQIASLARPCQDTTWQIDDSGPGSTVIPGAQ